MRCLVLGFCCGGGWRRTRVVRGRAREADKWTEGAGRAGVRPREGGSGAHLVGEGIAQHGRHGLLSLWGGAGGGAGGDKGGRAASEPRFGRERPGCAHAGARARGRQSGGRGVGCSVLSPSLPPCLHVRKAPEAAGEAGAAKAPEAARAAQALLSVCRATPLWRTQGGWALPTDRRRPAGGGSTHNVLPRQCTTTRQRAVTAARSPPPPPLGCTGARLAPPLQCPRWWV